MCLYEPRSSEGMNACTSCTPEYDLDVSAKIQSRAVSSGLRVSITSGSFEVVIAFKSANDYFAIKCDALSKSWMIIRCFGEHETVVAQSFDESIKLNVFFKLFIQVRGNSVSLDVNGNPVFTRIKMHDSDSLSGLMGVIAKVLKNSV
jgi:hypothetical protein